MIVTYLPFLEVLKDVSGGNKKIKNQDYQFEGLIPIIDQGKTLVGGYTDNPEYKFNKAKLPVIVFGDHTKNFKYIDQPFAMGADGIKILKPTSDKYYEKYLYHYLRQVRLTSGGYDRHYKYLIRISIPIPSLSEQKRIAAILDKAEALRDKRKKSIAKLDELLQSVFLDMFGDPVTNTMGWEHANLSSIGSVVTGNTPPRKKADYYGNYIEWIKSDNLNTEEYIITKASEYLSEEGVAVARTAPQGSILVTCIAGSPNCIGNLGYADRPVSFNQQINAFTPNDIDRTYFYYSLLKYSKKLIQRASTNGMKGLVSKSSFSSIQVIVPPPSLQDEFIEIFKKINNQRILLKKQLLKNYNLFISLQQRAFRGEL